MALYFGKIRILDCETDTSILVSNIELLNECLSHPYDTIKVSRIIFDSVTKITGEKVSPKIGYNQSLLYCWLERCIHEDSRYMKAKEKVMEQSEAIRKKEKEYRISQKKTEYSEQATKYERKKMLRYYRSSYNR